MVGQQIVRQAPCCQQWKQAERNSVQCTCFTFHDSYILSLSLFLIHYGAMCSVQSPRITVSSKSSHGVAGITGYSPCTAALRFNFTLRCVFCFVFISGFILVFISLFTILAGCGSITDMISSVSICIRRIGTGARTISGAGSGACCFVHEDTSSANATANSQLSTQIISTFKTLNCRLQIKESFITLPSYHFNTLAPYHLITLTPYHLNKGFSCFAILPVPRPHGSLLRQPPSPSKVPLSRGYLPAYRARPCR